MMPLVMRALLVAVTITLAGCSGGKGPGGKGGNGGKQQHAGLR